MSVRDPLPVFPAARQLAALAALLLAPALPNAVHAAAASTRPDATLIVVSTSDVKGKTGPCGCHIPKGGFSRREAFLDSLRSEHEHVVAVDGGGWFPEGDHTEDVATFVAYEMSVAGLDAVGISDRELQFGLGFLEARVRDARLPVTCANLQRRGGGGVFPAYRLVQAGGVNVGVFSLVSNTADLGPARDSLTVEDPAVAAKRTVAELRARGATVIVLLANLGKIEGEDLVTGVDGIDAVVLGRNVPILQVGRMVRNSVASYGGEQGHYIAVTTLQLDARGRSTGGRAATYMLGPEVRDKPATLARVKAFEEAHALKLKVRPAAGASAQEGTH